MKTKVKKTVSDEKWKTTTNRYVCFIDIMGFKDLVSRSSHNDIYSMMIKIHDFQKDNTSVNWHGKENFRQLVKTTTYSDSIMIYSCSDSYDSLYSFICTISGLSQDLLMEGIPHKGAIAFGTMTLDIDRSIFFGQPLIDAYLLQEEIKFYGVIVHGTAQKGIDTHSDIPFLKNHLCPLKNGNSYHFVVEPIFWQFKEFESENEILKQSLKKMRYNTSGSIRRYIELTEEFLEKKDKE